LIECYASRMKLAGLFGLTCVMVGMSYFCSRMPGLVPRLVGWFGVVFFGLGFIVVPWMLCSKGPLLVIDDHGIEDRRWKIGVIPWEDVHSLSVITIQSTKLLGIELVDPEKYLARLPRWQRSLAAINSAVGYPPFAISFAGLSPGIKEVWATLQSQGEGSSDEPAD
jgi:hypothetical protein